MTNYIRFDWAMKRLLRDKANHSVIEGLLTSLFGEKVTIVKFLESESNQDAGDDKFNRVDILAENDKQETHNSGNTEHARAGLFPSHAIWRVKGHHRLHRFRRRL